jgi:hypothetical protein
MSNCEFDRYLEIYHLISKMDLADFEEIKSSLPASNNSSRKFSNFFLGGSN